MNELTGRVRRLERELLTTRVELQRLRVASVASPRLANALAIAVAASILIAAAPKGTRVRAPFVVVDDANVPVFSIRDESGNHTMAVYNVKGQPVVVASTPGNSSLIKMQSTNLSTNVALAIEAAKTPLLLLRTGGAHNNRVAAAVLDGKPTLNLFNPAGIGIINLTVGEANGGLFQLADAQGHEIAAATVSPAGVGIVRTRPLGDAGVRLPKTGIIRGTGLPQTFICWLRCQP